MLGYHFWLQAYLKRIRLSNCTFTLTLSILLWYSLRCGVSNSVTHFQSSLQHITGHDMQRSPWVGLKHERYRRTAGLASRQEPCPTPRCTRCPSLPFTQCTSTLSKRQDNRQTRAITLDSCNRESLWWAARLYVVRVSHWHCLYPIVSPQLRPE